MPRLPRRKQKTEASKKHDCMKYVCLFIQYKNCTTNEDKHGNFIDPYDGTLSTDDLTVTEFIARLKPPREI